MLTATFSLTYAQSTGKLTGKITDKKTGEVLIGASILIEGISKGAATNVNGEYNIVNIPTGTYSVLVRYVGYQNKQISEVQVKSGDVTNLSITLDEANTQQLQAVTVKATFRQESVNSLYAKQKNSASITDGITAETIKRSPDRSTSDVLRRVSGATVQDNKFVVVRGLSDRYNTASLDGTSLPSTEPNRKAFSFDIVPANLVDNLIISKTATPNLSGDFAGGAVQIITKDIPEQNFVTINAGLGYNTNTTFKDFKSGYRNLSDYFGFDDGSRKLPSNFPSRNRIQSSSLTQAQQVTALRSLNPNFNIYNTNAFMNQNYQVSLGRVKDVGKNGNRFGAIIALTYRNSMQTIENQEINYNVYNFTDDKYRFSTNIGALANFAYTYGKNKITFKNIYNRSFDDLFLSRSGFNESTSYPDNRFTAFDLVEKSLLKTTLQGDHALGTNNSKLTWTASYSNISNNQPDQRKTNYSQIDGVYQADNSTVGKQNARFFSKLNEDVFSGQVDYSMPITMFKQKATFKTGLASQYRDRDFDPRFIGAAINSLEPEALATKLLPLNRVFSRSVINQGYYGLQDITSSTDPYKAHSLTNAAYAMLDNKFGEKFRLVWGLRVEKFDLKLNTSDASQKEVSLDNLDILPSANLTYSLTPKSNMRFAYSRTVARPELRELAPFSYYDFELLANVAGNPDLKRTQIHNIDLRYELYPSAGQIISASLFYKNFKNAIESAYSDVNSTPDFQYFNVQKANNFGVEFELRKTLDFITPSFKSTTFYTNVALIKSKVSDNRRLLVAEESGSRPMVGQAPYVINAGLLQTAYSNKLSVNLLYNRVGPRIFRARGQVFPSIYENARDVVDAQVGYRIQKNKGEFKLNASDLFNQNTHFYYKESTSQYNLNQGATIAKYKTGTTLTLAYSYTF